MSERWKPVVGYENYYEVSDLGNVRRIFSYRGRPVPAPIRPARDKDGYMRVFLSMPDKKRNFYVHRLVLSSFIGESALTVNHKNGVCSDNHLNNLEYLSLSENLTDSWKRSPRGKKGSTHWGHKITEDIVKSIRTRYADGESGAAIARSLGICQPSVSLIINRKTWRHV